MRPKKKNIYIYIYVDVIRKQFCTGNPKFDRMETDSATPMTTSLVLWYAKNDAGGVGCLPAPSFSQPLKYRRSKRGSRRDRAGRLENKSIETYDQYDYTRLYTSI